MLMLELEFVSLGYLGLGSLNSIKNCHVIPRHYLILNIGNMGQTQTALLLQLGYF